jgi:hypothetical protein
LHAWKQVINHFVLGIRMRSKPANTQRRHFGEYP